MPADTQVSDSDTVPARDARDASLAGIAVLVDIRDSRPFDEVHPEGALNLPYSARGLADRLLALLTAIRGNEHPSVILIADDETVVAAALAQLREEAPQLAARAVLGGTSGWSDVGLPTGSMAEIGVDWLAPEAIDADLLTLDVREPIEWEMGHVPGALLISLGELGERSAEVPTDRRVAIICEAGVRSAIAASILRAKGHAGEMLHAVEGTAGYRAAGLPMEYAEPTD